MGKIDNIMEKIKFNPAVCQVLIEYEKLYPKKKAREMWDYLLESIKKVIEREMIHRGDNYVSH